MLNKGRVLNLFCWVESTSQFSRKHVKDLLESGIWNYVINDIDISKETSERTMFLKRFPLK